MLFRSAAPNGISQTPQRFVHLAVGAPMRLERVSVLEPRAIMPPLEGAPLDLDDDDSVRRVDQQQVELANAHPLLAWSAHVQVVRYDIPSRLKGASKSLEGAPLVVACKERRRNRW